MTLSKKAHKPTKQAKGYHIHGTPGNSRKRQPTAKEAFNQELRTLRCIVCRSVRMPRTYPICNTCIRKD
jgi:hypothetical protein